MPDQKSNGLKYIFLGLSVAAFLSFLMCGVTIRREIVRFGRSQQVPVKRARGPYPQSPTAVPRQYPVAAPPQAIPPQPVPTPEARPSLFHWGSTQAADTARMKLYLGHWHGHSMTEQGLFSLAFEMRAKPDADGQFSGYLTMSYLPIKPIASLGKPGGNLMSVIHQMTPQSTILTGSPVGSTMPFHVDKLITAPDKCQLSAF